MTTDVRTSWMPKWNPPASCVLYLPGQDDAQSATIRDRSGSGFDGAITDATWARTERGLWYLDFNGASAMVDIGVDKFSEADFVAGASLLAWCNITALDATKQFIIGIEGRMFLQITGTTDRVRWQIFDGAENKVNGDAAIGAGEWYFFAGTWDTLNMVAYQDGVAQAGADTSNVCSIDAVNRESGLGAEVHTPGNWLEGGIALGKIFNAGLTAEQVLGYFNRERYFFGK